MPIYEYQCGGCGHQQEKLVFVANTVPPPCDACGRFMMARLPSVPAPPQFKGTRFFATDYKEKK